MWLSIDKNVTVPMLRQVYQAIRDRILAGELHAGYKLPSTRVLALQLNVSRNVILEAYEMLLAEGLAIARSGSGTYVAEGAVLPGYVSAPPIEASASAMNTSYSNEESVISFRTGLPALELFPRKSWADLLQSVCKEAPDLALGYGDPAGEPELRRELADYLVHTRGVKARPEHIVITSGAVQAIQLVTRLLLSAGDEALVEEPTNEDLKSILSATGATLRSMPVDDSGVITADLPQKRHPKLAYLTPSHQFPLGGILPIQRRIELIQYAARTGCLLLEDDYDSEFRYDGAPVHSLQSLDPERVLYVGTFSKVLFPALRIGYIVLPPSRVADFIRLKQLADYQTASLEQIVLSRYIRKRLLHKHVHKMKKVYAKRRQVLLDSLEQHFTGQYRICGRSAGLHLVAEFQFSLRENLLEHLRSENVFAAQLEGNRLLMGYGHLKENEIREGVSRIRNALLR
ncbi:PLP-dependent aminotransferase family protein [Paenibacillus polymyxa]|uniref:MocR-like pyridoxine biosynthesis transcription factor PdxR n=1 Tax=Paenibacillus polymyxa TaxID=1406 RepID=UPI002349D652|nr:PLP-dependent aminotransferase family protein [Paenibacillus polymyxa]WCM61320.1 PLP-dependent aminotransferase family protein [Paenibacillus polymyxa]